MIIRLPVPPSVNNMFNNRKFNPVNALTGKHKFRGRVISPIYKSWLTHAGTLLNIANAVPFGGMKVQVSIALPMSMRGDLDNRIKPVLDLLVRHKLMNDDKQVSRILVERHEGEGALISVEPFGVSEEGRRLAAGMQ